MIAFPNSKINIGLNILRRRPDGYHDISTVMVPTGWCDILEIVPAKGEATTLTVTGRAVDCPMEKNLVYRAYKAVSDRVELPAVDIFLHKVVPDGAGLGGGSADAAFTIKMLNEMFALDLATEQMAEIASTIGADCPFFIYNVPMLAEGTGTELSPISLEMAGGETLVIVKPHESVNTREAYSGVRPCEPATPIRALLASLSLAQWQGRIVNDFELSVFPSHPVIADIKNKLIEMGAVYASMSGSGSAVYGLFGSDILADEAKRTFPGCDVFVGPMKVG